MYARWSGRDGNLALDHLKSDRLATAKILLESSADRHARFFYSGSPADRRAKGKRGESVSSLAEYNSRCGGPEVVGMMSSVWVQPRTLQSTCRLVVRRHLKRPILLTGVVASLPLPDVLKSYVTMEKEE